MSITGLMDWTLSLYLQDTSVCATHLNKVMIDNDWQDQVYETCLKYFFFK